jgi:hypothetical protein
MKVRTIIYWIATLLFCGTMGAGGLGNLLRAEEQVASIQALSYPPYLMTILGVAKLLGVVALLLPGCRLLKEWAYAGFTFDLLGAAASYALVWFYAEMPAPLIVLGIGAVSYLMRPESRRV